MGAARSYDRGVSMENPHADLPENLRNNFVNFMAGYAMGSIKCTHLMTAQQIVREMENGVKLFNDVFSTNISPRGGLLFCVFEAMNILSGIAVPTDKT